MWRKLYPQGTTFMAENEGGDDGDDGEEQGGGTGDENQSDIDKLRAAKDAEIAELNKRLKALEDKANEQTKGVAGRRARAAALTAINQAKQAIEAAKADPAKAIETALERIDFLGSHYADSAAYAAEVDGMFREAKAESFALAIQSANGGEVETYRKQLLAAKNEDEMKLMADNLMLQTAGRKRNRNGNGNGDERPRQPDGGRGSPTRRNLGSQMADIDIETPEGRKAWEEKRAAFRKELQSANR